MKEDAVPSVEATLPRRLLDRVLRAAQQQYTVTERHVADLSKGSGDTSVFVIDPTLFGLERATATRQLVATAGPSRIVVYSSLTKPAVDALIDFVRAGVTHVLIADADDTPERIRHIVQDVGGDSLAEQLIRHLWNRIVGLPSTLQAVITDMIRRPEAYRDVADICLAAGLARRSCDRWFARASFVSVPKLVHGARVVRAVVLLKNPSLGLEAVAARLGASSAKNLSSDIRKSIGVSPRAAARLSDIEILEAVVAYVCERGGSESNKPGSALAHAAI
jgi:AraC-like DNA-binding protein